VNAIQSSVYGGREMPCMIDLDLAKLTTAFYARRGVEVLDTLATALVSARTSAATSTGSRTGTGPFGLDSAEGKGRG
jgi:hypothetical protein